MHNTAVTTLTLNPSLAADARPGLEKTVKELQQCLNRVEELQDSFREDFLKIFDDSGQAALDPAGPALSNMYFFARANLGGNAVSHLRYAADLADLACGLLPGPVSKK